jgi:hypothetical protein
MAEPQWTSDSQSSASLVISSLLASLNSDAASQTSSMVITTSISSSVPSQLSSLTTTAIDSTSYLTPTSPIQTSTTTSSSLSSSAVAAASVSSSSTTKNHTQTIILVVCFALLGLILIILAMILFRRYRRRQSPFAPFSRRGVSPIDDDEIATWRGNTQPMAKTPATHVRNASSIVFQPYQGWAWNDSASPDSTSPAISPPPGSGEALPYPPPPVAHAPNARSGLTDGAIPGAAPFVGPARRQSRRLSKAHSAGHMRSRSRRSSASVSSIREPRTSTSNSQWIEPEDWAVQRKRSNSGPRAAKTAVGRTSMGDDVRPGGLSPRPITAVNVPPLEIPGSAY